jgi:uncharacterized membrane protein
VNLKDTIAIWILAFFVLVPCAKAIFGLTDALTMNHSTSAILWYLLEALVLVASGWFLIARFITITDDLQYYKAQEKQRELELHPPDVQD